MCATCGCGETEHGHEHEHEHEHEHGHEHGHEHEHRTVVRIERAVLAENDRLATGNRAFFDARRIRCLNLISSPGAGKTTLLEKTLAALAGRTMAVIEGDQATDLDARRIAATGVAVTQIETGRVCHLDAHQIMHALERVPAPEGGLLFIENVGNLICPTEFALGEHERVVILSVAEGADKPAKYPLAFRTATCVVLSKIDLLPYVDFDLAEARRLALGLNPHVTFFELSARTGQGMAPWLSWLTTPQA